MLIPAIALFACSALLGVYMLVRVFKGALPPWPAAILHGLFAATGLALLLYTAFLAGAPQPPAVMIAAALLVIAALGGFVLVSFHIRKQAPPRALAGVHALAAVAGFLSLAGSVFGVI
ncbi:MAG: hypothetical protein IV086_09060 [Hyphomonadaceae bacterium]|jgi:hypothetical protein|nr:MAG: hypothetical protein FD160_323 [Caulobacteraceae bacterium]MBT9445832.1 hypothetical protein [Hyphomonadaceae bacterium]TPW05050.1 MAG: hypothetical protein FD124_2324 [Alphaproteobacteria bacterium]